MDLPSLPNELLFSICLDLDWSDIARLGAVDRRWYAISRDQFLVQSWFVKHYSHRVWHPERWSPPRARQLAAALRHCRESRLAVDIPHLNSLVVGIPNSAWEEILCYCFRRLPRNKLRDYRTGNPRLSFWKLALRRNAPNYILKALIRECGLPTQGDLPALTITEQSRRVLVYLRQAGFQIDGTSACLLLFRIATYRRHKIKPFPSCCDPTAIAARTQLDSWLQPLVREVISPEWNWNGNPPLIYPSRVELPWVWLFETMMPPHWVTLTLDWDAAVNLGSVAVLDFLIQHSLAAPNYSYLLELAARKGDMVMTRRLLELGTISPLLDITTLPDQCLNPHCTVAGCGNTQQLCRAALAH